MDLPGFRVAKLPTNPWRLFVAGLYIHPGETGLPEVSQERFRCHQYTTWYDSDGVSLPALRIVSDARPVMREILRSGFRNTAGSVFVGGFCGDSIGHYCPLQNSALASRMTYGRCRRLNPKRLLSHFY
jgi:hypothetical protein